MTKFLRELLSVINGILPKSLSFTHTGRKWKIPNVPRSMERLMRPGRDAVTAEWIKQFVPDADLVIDIGANVGQSLILYRSLYPDAEYIGFEPNPVCSSMIFRLVAMNGLDRCRIFTLGVGPAFEAAELMVDAAHLDDPTATLVSDCHAGTESRVILPIIITPLQTLIPDIRLSSSTIIKIDVEGFEADVLESLGELANQRPLIVSEVLAEWHGASDARVAAVKRIHAWVQANDYSIVAEGQGVVEEITHNCDAYFFVPSENPALRHQPSHRNGSV